MKPHKAGQAAASREFNSNIGYIETLLIPKNIRRDLTFNSNIGYIETIDSDDGILLNVCLIVI